MTAFLLSPRARMTILHRFTTQPSWNRSEPSTRVASMFSIASRVLRRSRDTDSAHPCRLLAGAPFNFRAILLVPTHSSSHSDHHHCAVRYVAHQDGKPVPELRVPSCSVTPGLYRAGSVSFASSRQRPQRSTSASRSTLSWIVRSPVVCGV